MASLFIVITKTERAQLCVSQQSLSDTISNLKSWPYSHNHNLFVFEPRALPATAYGSSQFGQPKGCVELAIVARVTPTDRVEEYQFALGDELDKLPPEQELIRLQQAIDYLEKKIIHVERQAVEPEKPVEPAEPAPES